MNNEDNLKFELSKKIDKDNEKEKENEKEGKRCDCIKCIIF